jgi:hypothetical protein
MKDIEDTEGLSKEQLHEALALGDARDRVLAIWALALRSAPLSFGNQLRHEPDPGVRRALAVVLASHGEIDLLVAICRHDPSVFVRASTVQILVRFAAADRVPWSLVVERLADEADVRASVFSQLDEKAPVELRNAVESALRDRSDVVRREAFETCARIARARMLDVTILQDIVEAAPASERAHLLDIWFRIEPPDVMCTILSTMYEYVRVQALLMKPALASSSLRPLLESAEVFRRVEGPLHLDIGDLSLQTLLALTTMDIWRLQLVRECNARLPAMKELPADLREIATALRNACARPEEAPVEEGDMTVVDDDDDLELDGEVPPSEYAMLRAELVRLVGA